MNTPIGTLESPIPVNSHVGGHEVPGPERSAAQLIICVYPECTVIW